MLKCEKMEHRKPNVIVITGASAGVGRATAREFAKYGSKLLLIARGEEALEATRKEVEEAGGQAWVYVADVANANQMNEAADFATEHLGPIDLWINNAMVNVFSRVIDMTPEEYRRVTEVSYLGQVYGTLAALQKMKERNYGKIILVGSALAFRGVPLQSALSASKHALQGFFESLRAEILHDNLNIDLSIVHLPAMNTTQFDWVKSRFLWKPQPMGKIYQPEIAARAIVEVAESGERLRMVGFSTVKKSWENKLVPAYMDRYMAEHGFSEQLTDIAEDPDRQDNLWKPLSGDHGSHGQFDDKAQFMSLYDIARRNKKSMIFIAGSLFGAALMRYILADD